MPYAPPIAYPAEIVFIPPGTHKVPLGAGLYEIVLEDTEPVSIVSTSSSLNFSGAYSAPPANSVNLNFGPVNDPNPYFDALIAFTGEALRVSLTTAQILLSLSSFSGERFDTTLTCQTNFSSAQYTGESGIFDLTLRPPITFNVVGYTGETGAGDLRTISRISHNLHGGEALAAVLTSFPVAQLTAVGYFGETLSTSISAFPYASPLGYTGETNYAAVTTYPNTGMPSNAYAGETAEASIRITGRFVVSAVTGETASAALSTTSILLPLGYTGETLSAVIDAHPASYITADGRAGESLIALLSSAGEKFYPLGHTGETFSAVFESHPAAELSTPAYTGETFKLSVAFAQQLGIFTGFEGSSGIFATLGSNPIIRAYEGGYAVATLAADITLPLRFYDGAVGSSTLKTGPSEGIGNLTAYDGEAFIAGALKVAVSAHLYVLFRNSYVTRLDIDSETDFDLISDASCCGPQDDRSGTRIDLGDAPPPGWTWSGYKQVFEAELSTRPRFSFRAYEGTEFTLKDYSAYLSINAYDGAAVKVEAFDALINIRLCRPNFIPDGNSVITELDTPYDENCASNFARTGESMSAKLSSSQGPTPRMFAGQTAVADLVVPSRWTLFAYTGEYAYVNNPEFSPRFPTGEALLPKLYEDALLAYDGARMNDFNLVTEYAVEFLEVGCFENEFIPLNENGDPIWELFNEVPVELDFYAHEIKARCF